MRLEEACWFGLNRLSGRRLEWRGAKRRVVLSFNTPLSGYKVPAAFIHQLKSSIKEKLFVFFHAFTLRIDDVKVLVHRSQKATCACANPGWMWIYHEKIKNISPLQCLRSGSCQNEYLKWVLLSLGSSSHNKVHPYIIFSTWTAFIASENRTQTSASFFSPVTFATYFSNSLLTSSFSPFLSFFLLKLMFLYVVTPRPTSGPHLCLICTKPSWEPCLSLSSFPTSSSPTFSFFPRSLLSPPRLPAVRLAANNPEMAL